MTLSTILCEQTRLKNPQNISNYCINEVAAFADYTSKTRKNRSRKFCSEVQTNIKFVNVAPTQLTLQTLITAAWFFVFKNWLLDMLAFCKL